MVDIVQKHKVNAIVTPPNQIALLLEADAIKEADLSSVWANIITGGRMNVSLRKSMKKYLTQGSVIMTYATTESGGIISTTTPFKEVSNSSGKILANIKLKVIDDEGKTLGPNETGEIHVFPRFKFLGYANNNEETKAACDSEGWLNTGDLGYFNDVGEIFVVDRKKEVFDHMNYQVFPSELESFIVKMEGVKAVCVVGVRDPLAESLAAAVVVKDEGSLITEQEIVDKVESRKKKTYVRSM